MTPEGRRRSLASRESMDRCTRMMATERERMKEVWCRMGKEQAALMEARDGMVKLTAKGTTELGARSEEMARRRPSINREHAESPDTERASHHPNKEATPATVGCAGCVATGCPASARIAAGLSPDRGQDQQWALR